MADATTSPGLSGDLPLESPSSVLLVDDNPTNLLTLQALLEGLEAASVEARSGGEALRLTATTEFAAVLLDVRMPELSGFDTAKLIRAQKPSQHTPIIFLTAGDVDREELEQGYSLGAVDFLVK